MDYMVLDNIDKIKRDMIKKDEKEIKMVIWKDK